MNTSCQATSFAARRIWMDPIFRCRVNSANTRQSRPDSGLELAILQGKVLTIFSCSLIARKRVGNWVRPDLVVLACDCMRAVQSVGCVVQSVGCRFQGRNECQSAESGVMPRGKRNPQPRTPNPKPSTPNPKPRTPIPQPQPLTPYPYTLNRNP